MADYDNVMRKIDYLDDTKQQIKDAIIEKGQQIEDDDPFREYVDKIKELSNGDIRLFNTIDEMNSDQKPKKENDLAVVYNRTLEPITANISFGSIVIPKIFHLGSISENSRNFFAYNSSSSIYGEMYIIIPGYNPEIDTTTINDMNIEIISSRQRLSLIYVGSDNGLTYTFDSGILIDEQSGVMTNLVFDTNELFFDFETSLNVMEYDEVFTGLFNVQKLDFQGLFQYKLNNLKEHTVYYGNNPHIDENTPENLIIDYIDWLDYSLFANDICMESVPIKLAFSLGSTFSKLNHNFWKNEKQYNRYRGRFARHSCVGKGLELFSGQRARQRRRKRRRAERRQCRYRRGRPHKNERRKARDMVLCGRLRPLQVCQRPVCEVWRHRRHGKPLPFKRKGQCDRQLQCDLCPQQRCRINFYGRRASVWPLAGRHRSRRFREDALKHNQERRRYTKHCDNRRGIDVARNCYGQQRTFEVFRGKVRHR